jgi:hypothetical protein
MVSSQVLFNLVLLDLIGRECFHAGIAEARQGYYFLQGRRGQWRTTVTVKLLPAAGERVDLQ